MYKSYILIDNVSSLDLEFLKDYLSTIFGVSYEIKVNDKEAVIIHNFVNYDEIVEGLRAFMYDTNLNIKIYVSKPMAYEHINSHIEVIKKYLSGSYKQNIYDDKSLLEEYINVDVFDYKKIILKDYIKDSEIENIILTFLECDMNTLKTSKKLYMHRNTLINKLDKFYEKTGFDLRNFKDAYIIYTLIK